MNKRTRSYHGVNLRPEHAVLLIGALFGLLIVRANPPFHSNDEDRHFYNSYFYSTGQNGMTQNGEQIGGVVPVSLFRIVSMYQGIGFSEGVRLSRTTVKESAGVPLNESETMFYDNPSYGINPVPYIPFIFGISISKIFNSNPIHLLWAARTAGLALFLVIAFLAVKAIPIHKWALLAVALSPMTLYQAASVSYDGLSMALSFLILALILRFAYSNTTISNKELAVFLVIAAFHRFAKDGYFLIPFLWFLVPTKKVGSITRAAGIFVALSALYFLPRFTWGAYLSSLHLHGGAVFMNDFLYDMGRQLDFYRLRPLQFLEYFSLNVVSQAKVWFAGAFGRFGYSYTVLTVPVVFLHGLVLITLSVLDASPHSLSIRQKLIVAAIAFGTIALIIVGFFLSSPVGARFIFGLQGRYFIPILPLLLLLNYSTHFRNPFWEKWQSVLVPSYCAVLLGYTVYFINDKFYLK